MTIPVVSSPLSPLRVSYTGCTSTPEIGQPTILLGAPWLAGEQMDRLLAPATFCGQAEGLSLYQRDGLLIGYGRAPIDGDLSAITRDLYRRVLLATKARYLCRVWNYVPRINDVVQGLENYRAFCQGRSTAFEENFGARFPHELSAASAVGSDGDHLELIFAAAVETGRHVENPEQVPAYHYPPEHGPRAPSFARATVAKSGGRTFTFISGTSAIKGHVTVAPGKLADQLECTLHNLRLISREVGAGDRLETTASGERHFKIYLRNASDLDASRAWLQRELLRAGDQVTYLRADICRAALNVEIEATLIS